MTPPSVLPRRSAATAAETAFAVLSREVDGSRRMTRVASGASACTISTSSTSSPKASQGERAPASVVIDPHPRGRQVEQAVEGRHVLAHVGDQRRVQLRFREFGQHDGLAAAVDPAVEERLDPVGHLELLRRVAGGHGVAVHRGATGRAGGRSGARRRVLLRRSAAAPRWLRSRHRWPGELTCRRRRGSSPIADSRPDTRPGSRWRRAVPGRNPTIFVLPILSAIHSAYIPRKYRTHATSSSRGGVRGQPIKNVTLVTSDAARQTQHVVGNYRPRSTLLVLSRLLGEKFAGTPIGEHFVAS